MSLFLDPSDILEQNDGLNYINYENINEDQKEFLLSNLWDWEFTVPPACVYFPGNSLLRTRMVSVTPTFPQAITQVSATIRQFKINQSVPSGDTNASVTINYVDREDQTISVFVRDWANKIGDPDTKFQYRKEDTICEGILTEFNTSRVPIRRYKCITGQPNSNGFSPSQSFTSEDPAQNGEVTLELNFEHYRLIWENLPD